VYIASILIWFCIYLKRIDESQWLQAVFLNILWHVFPVQIYIVYSRRVPCKRKIHYICRVGKLSFVPGIFIFRLTRRVSLVERGLLTLPEHMSSPGFQWGSCYSIFSFIFMFCRSLFVLLHFLPLAIVLYIFLRYTDSD
jgi:hypothetical protein